MSTRSGKIFNNMSELEMSTENRQDREVVISDNSNQSSGDSTRSPTVTHVNNKLSSLMKKLVMYHSKLSKLHTDDHPDSYIRAHVNSIKSMLSDLKVEFTRTHDLLEQSLLDEGIMPADDFTKISMEFDVLFSENLALIHLMLETPSTTETNRKENLALPPLPTLQLPIFAGDPTEWPNFQSLFKLLVVENKAISDLQKLQYLKGHVRGVPLKKIECLPLIPSSFKPAWESLLERYDSPLTLGKNLFNKLLNFRSIKSDSPNELYQFVDTFTSLVTSLKNITLPSLTEFMFVELATRILPSEIIKQFNLTKNLDFPTIEDLKLFVLTYIKTASTVTKNTFIEKKEYRAPSAKLFNLNTVSNSNTVTNFASRTVKCPCNDKHALRICPTFLKWTPSQRLSFVKEGNFCTNCLSPSHKPAQCLSKLNCRNCSARHNTLLHIVTTQTHKKPLVQPSPVNQQATTSGSTSATPETQTMHIGVSTNSGKVLLSTICLFVYNDQGERLKVRALADNCAQTSVITTTLVERLGLTTTKSSTGVTGMGDTHIPTPGLEVNCAIASRLKPEDKVSLSALVTKGITTKHPSFKIPPPLVEELRSLSPLADPEFHKPEDIHLLLGADILPQILRSGRVKYLGPAKPSAISSDFGWMFFGPCESLPQPSSSDDRRLVALLSLEKEPEDLSGLIKNFWELEEPSRSTCLSSDDRLAEENFTKNVVRLPSGRFSVALPFQQNLTSLGDNTVMAERRFLSLEKRLAKDPQLREQYNEFMTQYEELGHMEPTSVPPKYVIPHHPVFKVSGTENKLRVVFDASCPTDTGVSLNDTLLTGPKLQPDIAHLLTKFRLHKYVFTTDIVKMFRQFLVHPEFLKYQSIFWRSSPEEKLKLYVLKTVTYGVRCSPYLAVRALRQLAVAESEKFKLASRLVLDSSYVDDIFGGADTVAQAIKMAKELEILLKSAGLQLSKWTSNSEDILRGFSTDSSEATLTFDGDTDTVTKVLGLCWDPKRDHFFYKIQLSEGTTKRSVLSFIARIFDPLGGLAPINFWMKCFMQTLWKAKLDWDDPLPMSMAHEWKRFVSELPLLNAFSFPRLALPSISTPCQLIGFADASSKGYGAVLYLRSTSQNGEITTSFLVSKSKVAPQKTLTIPRLELCGALLLAKLIATNIELLSPLIYITQVIAFSDSTTALSWIHADDSLFKIFVSNRVAEIHRLAPQAKWEYIPSELNPADPVSRGLSPSAFLENRLFLCGPQFLSDPHALEKLQSAELICPRKLPDLRPKKQFILQAQSNNVLNFINNCSSWTKVQRVCAYIRRIALNFIACKKQDQSLIHPLNSKELSRSELSEGSLIAVREVQSKYFSEDIGLLNKNNSPTPSLRPLQPFIDDMGLLRVRGRLSAAQLPYDQKFPIILPKECHLTNLIIDHYHINYLHSGLRLTQSLILKKFWIVSARVAIKSRLNKCTKCARFVAKPTLPLMADLPTARVNLQQPFYHVGVDFAGPVPFKTGPRRNSPIAKAYIAIFICMATKAVHIELVSDLSTRMFLAALDRFIARRGIPSTIYSDCGKNFVGANNYLTDLQKLLVTQDNILIRESANRGISWRFNVPSAPHMGGLWESGVRSIKYHLKRTVANTALNFEEWATLLARIESILNSRPLTQLPDSPDEIDCLTPGHFLIGRPIVTLPEADDFNANQPLNRLKRWQLVSQFTRVLWRRFMNEYLYTLQTRSKWLKESKPLVNGQLVLVKDEQTAPTDWPLAKIVETYPDQNGQVRIVRLRLGSTYLKRPVHKLVPIPSDSQ